MSKLHVAPTPDSSFSPVKMLTRYAAMPLKVEPVLLMHDGADLCPFETQCL